MDDRAVQYSLQLRTATVRECLSKIEQRPYVFTYEDAADLVGDATVYPFNLPSMAYDRAMDEVCPHKLTTEYGGAVTYRRLHSLEQNEEFHGIIGRRYTIRGATLWFSDLNDAVFFKLKYCGA